jgi:hypothetical protein
LPLPCCCFSRAMSQNEEEDSYGLCHQFSELITKLKFSCTGNLYLFLGLQIDGEIKRLIAQPMELLTEICKQKFSFKTGHGLIHHVFRLPSCSMASRLVEALKSQGVMVHYAACGAEGAVQQHGTTVPRRRTRASCRAAPSHFSQLIRVAARQTGHSRLTRRVQRRLLASGEELTHTRDPDQGRREGEQRKMTGLTCGP